MAFWRTGIGLVPRTRWTSRRQAFLPHLPPSPFRERRLPWFAVTIPGWCSTPTLPPGRSFLTLFSGKLWDFCRFRRILLDPRKRDRRTANIAGRVRARTRINVTQTGLRMVGHLHRARRRYHRYSLPFLILRATVLSAVVWNTGRHRCCHAPGSTCALPGGRLYVLALSATATARTPAPHCTHTPHTTPLPAGLARRATRSVHTRL